MRWLRRAIGLGVILAVVVGSGYFHAVHGQPVTLDYYLGQVAIPLWVALLGAFGLGLGVAALVALYQLARLGLLARRYRRTASGLEREVDELRRRPLEQDDPSAGTAPDAASGA